MQDLLGRVGLLYSLDAGTSTRSASDQADALQIVAKKAERFVHAPLNQEGADERFAILIEAQRDNEIGMLNAEAGRLLKKEGHQLSDGANAAIEKVIALKLGQADQARCRMALEPFDIKKAAKQFVAATSGIVPNETMVYALVQRAVTEGQELAFDREVGGAMGSLMVESDVAYSAFPSIGRMLNSNTLFTRDKHARVHAILQGARPHTPNFAASVGEVVANAGEWAREAINNAAYDVSTSLVGRESPTLRFGTGVVQAAAKLFTLPTTIGNVISFVEDSDTRQRAVAGLSAIGAHPGLAYGLVRDELAASWSLNGAGLLGQGFGFAGGPWWLTSLIQKLGSAASLLAIDVGAAQPVLLRVEASRIEEVGSRLLSLSTASQTAQAAPVLEGELRHVIQMAPLFKEVPPVGYAGTERIIEYLIQEMVKRGYRVTLVASGDSAMAGAELITPLGAEKGLWKHPESWQKEHARRIHYEMVDDITRRALSGEFGPIGTFGLHNHLDYGFQRGPLGSHFANLTTVHGWLGHPDLKPFHDAFKTQAQVSISKAQQAYQEEANWVANIHHGLPADWFSLGKGGEHVVWLGRSHLEKGPDAAIRIAKMANVDIRLAGKNSEIGQKAYFDAHVARLLDGRQAVWEGEILTTAHKQQFLGEAGVCVCPYNWPEPFGMVFIEALATGTPVIAYGLGSVPEIIRPGFNGFIIDVAGRTAAAIEKEAAERIPEAMQLSRAAIRDDFVKRFSSARMADDYVRVFEQQNRLLQLRNPPQPRWSGWTAPSSGRIVE
jgi:glycosyltransferase involved in cell wall biosynthesis